MAEISGEGNRIWVDEIFLKLPISHFAVSYLVFLFILFIYIYIDMNTNSINLQSNSNQLIGALVTSFLIPFEFSGINLLIKGASKRFLYLDDTFRKSQSKFYESLTRKMAHQSVNYLFLLLFVGLPLALLSLMSWGENGFSDIIKNNISEYTIPIVLDLINCVLLFVSISFFCAIVLIIINIYCSFHTSVRDLKDSLSAYNTSILKRKLLSIRTYFLMTQLFMMICVAMINISIFGTKFRPELSAIFLLILFLFTIALTLLGLTDAQDILDIAIDKKMDRMNAILEESSRKMSSLVENGLKKGDKDVDTLQEIIEFQQKDLEKIFQERIGFNIKDSFKGAAAFIASTVIPIASFIVLDLLKPNS
jgi:hypothetical protein